MRLITGPATGAASASMIGGIVCRDVRRLPPARGVLFRKGHVLTEDDVIHLAEGSTTEIRVLMPEPDDEPESSAAARLAAAVAGRHVVIDPPHQGQATLRAERRGLLRVRAGMIRRINRFEGVLAFTGFDATPVDQGTAVGATKVAPLLISRQLIDTVVEICQTRGPLIEVVPFTPTKVALVSSERLNDRSREQAQAHLSAKLSWFGSTIECVFPNLDGARAVTNAFMAAQEAGVGLVLAAGGVATDPADSLVEGLLAAGGQVDQMGLPIDPGTACWVGRLGSAPIIGLASCELFGRLGAVDLLLPRALAGERLTPSVLQTMAHGGLLDRHLTRIPSYKGPNAG